MPPSSRRTKRRKSLLLLRSSKGGGLAPDTPSRLRSPDHQREKSSHFPSGFSVDFSRSLHFRHGFAHLAGVSGADPGRTAGSFSSECPGGGAPARKRWGGTGVLQRQRPPPAAETGSCCWDSGQQNARLAQGPPHALGAATRTHLRGESPPACGGYFTLSRNRTKPARPASSSL